MDMHMHLLYLLSLLVLLWIFFMFRCCITSLLSFLFQIPHCMCKTPKSAQEHVINLSLGSVTLMLVVEQHVSGGSWVTTHLLHNGVIRYCGCALRRLWLLFLRAWFIEGGWFVFVGWLTLWCWPVRAHHCSCRCRWSCRNVSFCITCTFSFSFTHSALRWGGIGELVGGVFVSGGWVASLSAQSVQVSV